MTTTTASNTIKVLRGMFSTFGFPRRIVSDNGPQFTSSEFKGFLQSIGARHTFSAPYYPATNGAAENLVKRFKAVYKKLRGEGLSIHAAVDKFLLTYRTTPHSVTGESPAKLMFGRELRTKLSLLLPSKQVVVPESVSKGFSVEESVYVKDYHPVNKEMWIAGKIGQVIGPRMYLVQVEKRRKAVMEKTCKSVEVT
eukprot:Pompholyxophrys_punicea_v1_NODE_288_length_2379_cov_34.988812.p1 type:complete len:196 gc:universal NODE_288_length_2379_cov_34.988812:645-58(-)